MSKPIRSYPKDEQKKVVERRIQGKTGGLGYLSALAYFEWKKNQEKKEKELKEI